LITHVNVLLNSKVPATLCPVFVLATHSLTVPLLPLPIHSTAYFGLHSGKAFLRPPCIVPFHLAVLVMLYRNAITILPYVQPSFVVLLLPSRSYPPLSGLKLSTPHPAA
jgi:hypothetical protein